MKMRNEILQNAMEGEASAQHSYPARKNTARSTGTGKKDIPELSTENPTYRTSTQAKAGENTSSAAGKYYSRPEMGDEYELHEKTVKVEKALLDKAQKRYDNARQTTAELEEAVAAMDQHAQILREQYAGSKNYKSMLATAQKQANEILLEYAKSLDTYESATAKFNTAADRYNSALGSYNSYAQGQRNQFNSWKQTIRDADTVAREMQAIDEQIARLQEAERSGMRTGAYQKTQGTLLSPYGAALSGSVEAEIPGRDTGAAAQIQALEQAKALLQEEYDWSMYYKYADLMNNDDFGSKSQYASTANGNQRSWLEQVQGVYVPNNSPWEDPLYEYINGNREAGLEISNQAAAQWQGNAIAQANARLTQGQERVEQMTQEEVSIYNYLYATQGKEAANEYYEYLKTDLNKRQREADEAAWREASKELPVLSSVISVAMSPLRGAAFLGQAADYFKDGKIDENDSYNRYSYLPGTVRTAVSEQIEEKWGPAGSFAYQTGMSMADFLLNSRICGGSQAVSLAIMGTGAAADTTIAAKERGVSDGKALLLGTIAGAAEAITEKVSIDALLNADLLTDSAWKYILKNALSEGTEEVGSNLINLVADVVIARDQSEWRQSIDACMEKGMNEQEAVGKAVGDQLLTMLVDFAGGAISGGIMGSANAGIHAHYTNQIGQQLADMELDAEDIQAFIKTGLESGHDTASYQLAVELQAKIQKGETLSNYDLSRLWQANIQAVDAEESRAEDAPENANTADTETPGQVAGGNAVGAENGVEGLRLPSLENETQEAEEKTNPAAGSAVVEAGAPISIAQQLRQEQTMNGGMNNVNTQTGAAGSETAQPGGGIYAPEGIGLPDGSGQRDAGAGTGEQAGGLATGAAVGQSGTDRSRETVARQNLARSLRLEKVSSQDLGLVNGTETKNIQVFPQEHWDGQMQQLASRIYNETGKNVTFCLGRIQIRGAGGAVGYARGVITGDRIIVQADNFGASMEQIADHEGYHAKAEFAGRVLNDTIRQHIVDTFTEEQFRAVLDKYIVGLRGVIDVNDTRTGEEFEAAIHQIEEEVFADAYAGINAFGAHAEQFTQAVNEKMDQLYMGKQTSQENGTAEPTGPPAERYSIEDNIVGENGQYGPGVILDTPLFDGVKPRHWGKVLGDYVYRNLAGTSLTVYDEAGNGETIHFARVNDRVTKDGARNSHKVIDELARYRGDNVRALATVHLSEALTTSRYENSTGDNTHQWMDQNGWEHRYTYLQDASGNIYEATLNIAKGRNRNILYSISNIRKVDKNGASDGAVPSTDHGRGSHINRSSVDSVTESGRNVNRKEGETGAGVFTEEPQKQRQERYSYAGEEAGGRYQELQGLSLPTPEEGKGYEGRSLTEDGEIYTYDFLTSQPDMRVVQLPELDSVRNAEGRVDTAKVVAEGLKNARSVGTERDGKAFVENRYTGRELYITGRSLRHSVDGKQNRLLTNARLGSVIGNIVQNAIPINSLKSTAQGASGTYAMAGFAVDTSGREFVAIVTVEQYTDSVTAVAAYDVAHSVSGRQKRNSQASTKLQGFYPIKAVPIISIADLIDEVNSTYQSILPENILNTLGATRNPEGHYSDRVRYSIDDGEQEAGGRYQELQGLSLPSLEVRDAEHGPGMDDTGHRPADTEIADNVRTVAEKNGAMPFNRGHENGEPGGNAPSVLSILERIRDVKEQAGTTERYSADEVDNQGDTTTTEAKKPKAPRKKVKPVAESKPLIAKRDLRNTVFNLFSIPSEQRTELGSMIDNMADRLIKNGSLTEEDRQHFFDRMYESGVMAAPADEYYADARNYIKGGKIFVSDSVVADFGDDWNEIRRRAFAAGIYLTRNRDQLSAAGGIDTWNRKLAQELPGLFDSEETDMRTILERIVQVAEEGRDQKMSLPEYTRWLAENEGYSEDEFLDNMERQLDWALRTFAEKAKLEVHLRDRTGSKITQEREKSRQQQERQRAKEAQRRADEREARKESARRQRERKELQDLQQRTLKTLQWLNKNRYRAPEELRAAWDEVLGDIDLYAVSAADEMRWSEKHNATWKDLAQMYKDAQENDPNFLPSKELERIVTRLDGTKIAEMDLGALTDLYKAAIGLRTEFYNRNNVINDEMQRLFAEVYTDAKREFQSAPGGYTGGALDKLMNQEQLTPMNFLQRMGGWDPDGTFYSMARQLERGERDIRAYKVKANRMLETFLTEHEDWVKRADGQGKDGLWYEIKVPQLMELGMGDKPIFGPTVKVYMTPTQKVHMYLESKNFDNLRHMVGGRTFADKELYSQGKRQEAMAQGRTIRMAPETVRRLVSDLTPEEMELARILEQYYNTFATQEINRVSNTLYGYDKAMGKNYAPIYTNQNYVKTEFGVFDVTAEGVGNLKSRRYAVNPSYNISALEAFERHVDQTARFVGMAIPARNWTTLMNWREENNSTGDVITHKWGEEAKRYITDLITTLQSGEQTKSDAVSSTINKAMSNYISAVFGANPSIVLKQLGSIPMASAYLDARNFPSLSQIRNIDKDLIAKYSQDLAWRTMGYSTPETKQLKENPNWAQTNKYFKFIFGGGAITAMDGWAASTLWPWAENKVRRDYPELKVGTKEQVENGESEFYKKVAEVFEDAMARSQSTSDEIHQSSLRKSKTPLTKAFTLFRSDSAQTYNAIRQKIGEAQYYARSGAKPKVLQAARKAAGAAFCSMMLNAVWSEAVTFLMALWKHKDKRYRDDEGELTAESVIGEMFSGMFGSFAGTVVGGEELYEVIGSILTGDTWYGIDTPGMEQLNDAIESIMDTGSSMRDLISGGRDILKNGGDLGAYFGGHTGELLGNIKELAATAATYLPGLPVNNLEAYLLGALKWAAPEWAAAYEDLFKDNGKSDLSGLEGDALEHRLGNILGERNVTEDSQTVAALADLYQEGYKGAVPSDIPTSVTINGESRKLGEYQKQAYGNIWSSIVAEGLDEVVSSETFQAADAATQEKMLKNLYDYAADLAKAELFDDYELQSGTAKNSEIMAAGASVADCMLWNTATSDMKSGEKAAWLAEWDLPEETKKAIFENKISDSRTDTIEAFQAAGLTFDQFLQAYGMYGQVNSMDLKASMKAVEFSHWVNDQGYTREQAAIVKDEFSMSPASSNRYDKLVEAGMDPDDAYDLTGALDELQPEEGEDEVSDLQKWRACVHPLFDTEKQLSALSTVMSDSQYQKVEMANAYGVKPETYVEFHEIKATFDADANGNFTQAEVKAAIDSMDDLTRGQKAVLWQLANSSWKARKNPYDPEIGQEVVDARERAK